MLLIFRTILGKELHNSSMQLLTFPQSSFNLISSYYSDAYNFVPISVCLFVYLFVCLICYLLEKEMATHSSVLAWRIPGAGEPGGLTSMGSHRVGHDWSDLAAAAICYLSFCLFISSSPDKICIYLNLF